MGTAQGAGTELRNPGRSSGRVTDAAGGAVHPSPGSTTDQSSNAALHGKSTGDASFLFNPKMYPPSQNPAVEQFPVRNVVKPSIN